MTKPKFKIGDVVVKEFGTVFLSICIITKIARSGEDLIYNNQNNFLNSNLDDYRLATPEEIKFYVK